MKEIKKRTNDTNKAKEYFLNELAYTIGPLKLKKMLEKHLEEFDLFDLREYEDFIKGHIPFASHLPADQLEDQLVKFSKEKINILYSYNFTCHLAAKCAYKLADEGYPVMVLTGGFKGWKKNDFDIIEDDVSDYPG